MIRLLTVVLALSLAGAAYAQQTTPGFMKPEVLAAVAKIEMNEEQQAQFREALGQFVDARVKAIRKLIRSNSQTNLSRKIRSRTNSLLKQLDKDVAVFLTGEQMPAYQEYRDALKANLRGG